MKHFPRTWYLLRYNFPYDQEFMYTNNFTKRIQNQLGARAEPGGLRGVNCPPWLLEKYPWNRYIMNYSLILYLDKKKTPILIHVQTLNTKKIGKKILLPCTKSYHFFSKFTILISFISLLMASPILLFLFFSIIVFSLLFTTLFLVEQCYEYYKFYKLTCYQS